MEPAHEKHTILIPFICLKAPFLEPSSVNLLKPNNNLFSFLECGFTYGHVETISSAATVDEQRGLIYKAKVLLTNNSLMVDGREVQLVPGMGVSAEIKIGKRLLIEYITAPLLRYKDESLSEK